MWGRWFCNIRFPVQPGRRYRITAHIKTHAVYHGIPSVALRFLRGEVEIGALYSRNVYDSDWVAVETTGPAPPGAETARVTCEASGLVGVAWFDDIEVTELPQPGVWVEQLQVSGHPHGLRPGETLSASVNLRNPLASRRNLRLRWDLTDAEGRLVWLEAQDLTLSDTVTSTITVGPQDSLGYFTLGLRVYEHGTLLAEESRGFPVLPALPDTPLPHVPWNVIAANQYALVKGALTHDPATWRTFARMMRAAGVTDLRIWEHWTDDHHPSPGVFSFPESIYDLACRVAREEGMRVSMVFWGLPDWVRGPEEDWHCYQFMRQAARRYQEVGVDRFEIDNEPWNSQRYLDRLKAGYLAVKAENPEAEALMAGLYWAHRRPSPGYFTYGGNLFNALGELAAPYTDRINWHEYYNNSPPELPLSRDLATHRDILDSRFSGNYGASLYMTETAYHAFSPGPIGHVTELEQAQWGVRLYLITLRDSYLDLDNKAFWYYYLDDNAAPYYACAMSGLLRLDMSPKPSYVAMRNLAPLLEAAEPVGDLELAEPLHALVFRRGAEPIVALWSQGEPVEAELEVGSPAVTLLDLWGNASQADTHGGKLALHVSGSVQYVLGAQRTAVFAPALAAQLKRLCAELSGLRWPEAAPLLARAEAAAASLEKTRQAADLAPLAADVESLVDDLVDRVSAGEWTVRQAGPRFSLLRLADAARIGTALLAPGDADVVQAIAEAEALSRRAVEALGPLSGQVRARTFLQLGQRRLGRARWQHERGWDAAVTAETARLAARDLRLAQRLSEVEANPRLDVWLSSPRYELESVGGPVEAPVAIHNASSETARGALLFTAPEAWDVTVEPSLFEVGPQERVVVSLHARPQPGRAREGVLRVWARLGERETTPLAFSLRASLSVEVRWHPGEEGVVLEVRNASDQPLPETVFMADGIEPAYVALPNLGPGEAVSFRAQAGPSFDPSAPAWPCHLISPELRWSGVAVRATEPILNARPAVGTVVPVETGPWLIVGPFDNPQEIPGISPIQDKGHEADYLTQHGGEAAIVPAMGMTHSSTVAPGGLVSWQPFTGDPEWVDLESIFGPSDYRVAYLATTIHSPGDGLIVLELGSDDGVKVFHEGRQVWSNPARRSAARGQDRVAVRLHAGSNRILLKCFDATGEWVLSFRPVWPGRVSAEG